jgi:Cytochrome c554 and c-prime
MTPHRLRNLKLLSSALLWTVCVPAFAQVQQANRAAACAGCHAAQSSTQPRTPMGRALLLPDANVALKAHPKLTFHKGRYSYTVETQNAKSTYSVTDGPHTISLPILWSFGEGAQTWILERDGKRYESLVSYYPQIGALDITTGDEGVVPRTIDEAMGRPLTDTDTQACFGCHTSNSSSHGKLNLTSLEPGLTCEHCHEGASTHLADAIQGQFDSAPKKLKQLSSEDLSNFCGQCHRSWELVVRSHWRGVVSVRFQPYRLANSKCFNGIDPRISCIACHDPHQDVVRETAAYDPKCLACHASSTRPASLPAPDAKACPVAKSDCASCHMPRVTLPDGHMTFADHEIRVVKPGDAYPN